MNCIKNAGFVYFCFRMNNGNTIKHELHKKCKICVFLFSYRRCAMYTFLFFEMKEVIVLFLQITEVNSNSLSMCAMSYWSSLHSICLSPFVYQILISQLFLQLHFFPAWCSVVSLDVMVLQCSSDKINEYPGLCPEQANSDLLLTQVQLQFRFIFTVTISNHLHGHIWVGLAVSHSSFFCICREGPFFTLKKTCRLYLLDLVES